MQRQNLYLAFMNSTLIKIDKDNRIGFITLCRAEKKNALSDELVNELTTAITSLENDDDIKVIVLIRTNIFKTVLSRYRKSINRVAHVTDGAAPDIHFSVPAQKMMEQMKELHRANNKLLNCSEGMNRLVMHYEDFFNWDETMNKVQAFLGVKILALPPVLKKVGADKWQNEVENYKEVEALLQQNNFSEYI